MPNPRQQYLQRGGNKTPRESEILVMHLEVGHRGLQVCHSNCLLSTLKMGEETLVRSRERRYATASNLEVSDIDRGWEPNQSDRGYPPPLSTIDLELTR